MLFVQGYLDTNYQFLIRQDGADIATLDDLKGRTIAVNNGSAYDTWLTQNADKYGFKIERYGKTGDAYQAVLARRAEAATSTHRCRVNSRASPPRLSVRMSRPSRTLMASGEGPMTARMSA
jgi:hypothetical protein